MARQCFENGSTFPRVGSERLGGVPVEAADELLAVAVVKDRVANLAGDGGYAIRELNLHTIYDFVEGFGGMPLYIVVISL